MFFSTTLSFSFFVFLIHQWIATYACFKPLVVGDVLHHFLSDALMCFTIQGPAEASAHLPAHTNNKEQPQHCFTSWSLSSLWLHFLLSLLGRDFLEDLCTLISESKTACFTRQAQYKMPKKNIYFVLKILHLTPAGPISSLPPSLDHSSDLCILKMNTTAVIGVSHMWVAVFLFSGTEWCCWN